MTTSHKNEFCFNLTQNVQSITFQFSGEHSITSGQPWNGVTTKQDGRVFTITIDAGRKGSSEVASWFNSFVGSNYNNMIHTCGGDNIPKELNFAITGTLTIDGEKYEICLGQGHRSSTGENNWHLASRSIIADSDAKNGTIGLRLLQDGTHAFDVVKS